MDSAASPAFLRSRLGWLLALVLLLPLAQAFAARHLLSHAQTSDAARSEGSYAVYQSVCDICLTVAAVWGRRIARRAA